MSTPSPSPSPQGPPVLLAVFASGATAQAAADAAVDLGVPRERVRVGAEESQTRSVVAEMREEAQESWIAPQVGIAYTPEAARSTFWATIVLSALGAVILAPFGPLVAQGIPWWGGVVLAATIGALLGGSIALILGPAIGARGGDSALAAEEGTVVEVTSEDPSVEAMILTFRPERLDRVVGSRIEVVHSARRTS